MLGAGIWLSRNRRSSATNSTRRQLIALTAGTHQQPIHKNGVLISLFGLHEREENHRLIPLGNMCPPISPIQQQGFVNWARQIKRSLNA
jgi:hypothetical protein